MTDRTRGFNIRGLEGLETVVADVTDAGAMRKCAEGMDYVFHSAAKVQIESTRRFPQDTLAVNIIGTFNVAQAARDAGAKRMVHVSTCHIYGNQPGRALPLKETAKPNPHDIYAVSKVASELVLKPFVENGLDVVVTRAFNHYGPGQIGDFFVPRTVKQLLQGQTPRLGNPNPTRDYTYVGDIAAGYLMCAQRGKKGEAYHFSSGKETSIGEMYKAIAAACGSPKAKAEWSDFRKHDMDRSYGSSAKARRDLGWKPRVGLKEGLGLTVEWWRSHPEIWKR